MRTQDYAEEYLDAINNNNNNAQNISQEHVHVHVQQEQTSPNGKAAVVFLPMNDRNNFF